MVWMFIQYPQPVPVDITYSVKIVCNRMRELNKFNQVMLKNLLQDKLTKLLKVIIFQLLWVNYRRVNIGFEKRKYYIQSYEFTMLGFLIDEDEFEVQPAITRVLQVVEFDKTTTKRNKKNPLRKVLVLKHYLLLAPLL
jgi:hypothetical protein